jgi:hypothetical protein
VRLFTLHPGNPLPSKKIPGTRVCQGLSQPKDNGAAGRIMTNEKPDDLTGDQLGTF